MGLLDKIKTMFTEEIEEEEPIKKEVIQVEIPSPATKVVPKPVEETTKKTVEVVEETPKKEEKFKFPVYFDDKDFDRLEQKKKEKEVEKPSIDTISNKISSTYKGGNNKPQPKEEKKVFKPTPIISPVYGVLDKNYSKDDVVSKPVVNNYYKPQEKVTVDDIRQKAYGTLEEDLENTLFGNTETLFVNTVNPSKIEDSVEDMEDDDIDFFTDLEGEDRVRDHRPIIDLEDTSEIDAIIRKYDEPLEEELDKPKETKQRRRTDMYDEENKKSETVHNMEESNDEITESDLFNLIDSVYEKGDE